MARAWAQSKHVGRVSEITIVSPIREGTVPGELQTYRQRLERVLEGLQERIDDGVSTPPGLIETIHFARWFILDLPAHSALLVFTSNFDGDIKQYFRDFSVAIPQDIDEVWENCTGYPQPNGCRDFEAFWRFARDHQVETTCFVPAYPDLTVKDIRLMRAAQLRREVDA